MRWTVLSLVILITTALTFYSLLRTPSFQKLAGRLAADYITRNYGIEIHLEKLRISDLLFIEIEGLKLMDTHRNPLLEVGSLRVMVREISMKEHYIWLGSFSLEKPGFFLHRYESDSLVNLAAIYNILIPPSEDTLSGGGTAWNIYCDDLTLEDASFGFTDDRKEHTDSIIDFTDLLLTEILFSARDISLIGDSVSAVIEQLSLKEKSGFQIHGFKAAASVSGSGIRTKELELSTDGTAASMDLNFLYNGWEVLSYFLDSVYVEARIGESVLTLADIGYFATELKSMKDPIMFSGNVNGFISDFSAEDFSFNIGKFTDFRGDIAMKGIPFIDSTFFDLNIDRFILTPEDIEEFDLPLTEPNLFLPEPLNQLGMTTITGTFKGYLSNFNADLHLVSDAGSVDVTAEMKESLSDRQPLYSGNITGRSVDLQAISGLSDLGLADFEIEFEGRSLDPVKMEIILNGWVENMEYHGYRYEKIIFGGKVMGKSYDGRLIILDPALGLEFNGMVDFNAVVPEFRFDLEVITARLYDLHLSDKSSDLDIAVKVSGDFKGIKPDDFIGNIHISQLVYHENGQNYKLDRLDLVRIRKPGERDKLTIGSDYLDAELIGPLDIESFTSSLSGFLFDPETHPGVVSMVPDHSQSLDFDIQFSNIRPVTDVFFPGFWVSPGASLSGSIDFAAEKMDFSGNADSVYASGIFLEGFDFQGHTRDGKLEIDAGVREVILMEEDDANNIGLPNFKLISAIGQDTVAFRIAWDNEDELAANNAEIDGFLVFPAGNRLEGSISRANARFNDRSWSLEGENYIIVDSAFKEVRNLKIIRGDESLTINGRLSDQPADTMAVRFENWDLSSFNPLLENSAMSLNGVINGTAGLFYNEKVPNIFAGITIKDFHFNEVLFGDAAIKTRWLESDQGLAVDVDIFSNASSGEPYRILGVNGLYYPFDEKQNFDFDINLQNLNISVLEPLVSSFSSKLGGFATGRLGLHGTLEKPILAGRIKLQRGEMMVDYLNVTYSFSNEIIFDEDYIHFDRVSIYDPETNEGSIEGGIRHRYFSDFSLDLTLEPKNLLAMNLNRYQNEIFYGTAYATGKIRLSGPFDRIAIEVDVTTDKGTKVNIPINYSVDVSQGDFIVFTNQEDTVGVDEHTDVVVKGISLDINLNINRNADINISLPGDLGFIKASGNGNLHLGVDPNGYLTLKGSYIIQTGLFSFSLEQLVSRRFDILEGSNISWTGDINDAEVNIVARYKQRTSLVGLGSSLIDPEAASQKVNVYTDIRMTGSLFNPDLSFGIYFPNMQEQDKQAVYAVLDTNDQSLMNQQAISLLVLNSFSTTSSSGISNPVNPASIMSNTLSSMLSQISNDFDIGINYMPGDKVTSEQLEVALSTQLFNDRLIIDGNIDVSPDNSTSQHTSAIVGDVNVEYKLTKDGRFRVKAFNRSNDLSLLNDYAPYTQGVGIFYRKEFNKVSDLFKREVKRESKRGD